MFKKLLLTLSLALSTLCSLVTPSPVLAEDPLYYARALSTAFEQVATTITPSIVGISSVKKIKTQPLGKNKQVPMDPFFERFKEFFGDEFPGNIPFPQQDSPIQQGLGTGVIVSSDGYILTNNHVVGDADEVTVKLHDQSEHQAEVVGADPRTDLAVIRIKAKDLAPAQLGDSDSLKIGEWVIAAGNPFGLENSITSGIVSAKGRSLMGGGQFEDFIQTDAAINPGNSGGPLVNLSGEVIGINTAIFSRSGGYMGIGFAIPINMARAVMGSLIKDGKVVRGWLGVGIQNLTEDLAQSFNYGSTKGALVGHIQSDAPAAGALRDGDIIVKFDGKNVGNVNELRNLVAATKPNVSVPVIVHRDGKETEVKVTLGELPAEAGIAGVAPSPSDNENIEQLGLTVEPLTPEIARKLKTTKTKGVIVSDVLQGGLASTSGIEKRDVIISINGEAVHDIATFRKLTKPSSLAKGIRVVVETQGMTRFVFIKSK